MNTDDDDDDKLDPRFKRVLRKLQNTRSLKIRRICDTIDLIHKNRLLENRPFFVNAWMAQGAFVTSILAGFAKIDDGEENALAPLERLAAQFERLKLFGEWNYNNVKALNDVIVSMIVMALDLAEKTNDEDCEKAYTTLFCEFWLVYRNFLGEKANLKNQTTEKVKPGKSKLVTELVVHTGLFMVVHQLLDVVSNYFESDTPDNGLSVAVNLLKKLLNRFTDEG